MREAQGHHPLDTQATEPWVQGMKEPSMALFEVDSRSQNSNQAGC